MSSRPYGPLCDSPEPMDPAAESSNLDRDIYLAAYQPNARRPIKVNTLAELPICLALVSTAHGYTPTEYDRCYAQVQNLTPGVQYDPTSADSLRELLKTLLPKYFLEPGEKTYWKSHQRYTDTSETVTHRTAADHDLAGLAFISTTSGRLATIGFGFSIREMMYIDGVPCMRPALDFPAQTSEYLDSVSNRLTDTEMATARTLSTTGNVPMDIFFSRTSLVIAVKEAYKSAIDSEGGNLAWTDIQVDWDTQEVRVKGKVLNGWEFDIVRYLFSLRRGDDPKMQEYQCVTAMFRGSYTNGSRWLMHKMTKVDDEIRRKRLRVMELQEFLHGVEEEA